MKEASFYSKLPGNIVSCELCPHYCKIKDGFRGICNVRVNKNGLLISEAYGSVVAINSDPIEKKPLYHCYPEKNILSIGTVGCNMKCKFCQNSDISQSCMSDVLSLKTYNVNDIVKRGLNEQNCIGIAYTYNEPTIYFEYMLDIARLAKKNNLKNVMVSNGYINIKPLKNLIEYIDAFNIDLKAFNDNFYINQTGSRIDPVKKTLKYIADNNKHLEITNLVIPTLNDDEQEFEEMAKWISKELGKNTVLHLSRYFPRYKLDIESTPLSKLEKLYVIAKKYLHYVYIGNVQIENTQNTFCNECNSLVIIRNIYNTSVSGLDENGNCSNCSNKILNFI